MSELNLCCFLYSLVIYEIKEKLVRVKKFYIFLLINLILSIIFANIYSIKMNFIDSNNKFTIINTFAVNNNIKDIYNIEPIKKYQFDNIAIYNSFNRQLAKFNIYHSMTGEHIIAVYNMFNHILNNKLTISLALVSQNMHVNILFINIIFLFILFYLLYLCITYVYKNLFTAFTRIDLRIDKIKANNYITIILLLTSLILFTIAYFTNYISEEIFNNFDELFLFDVLNDLIHGGSINNWHLPSAFQFFPALPILAVISLFTMKIYYIAYYYAIIQILLFYFILAYWLRLFLSSQKSYYLASIFVFGAVYFGIIINDYTSIFNTLFTDQYKFSDYNFLFIHSFHFETFMLGILSCGLILNCYKANSISKSRLSYLSLIQILATMSDRFFVIWIVAPLLILLCILYLTDNYFKKILTIKLVILLCINTIIALILYKISFTHTFDPKSSVVLLPKFNIKTILMIVLDKEFIYIKLIFIGLIIFLLKNNQSIMLYFKTNHLFKFSLILLQLLFIVLMIILNLHLGGFLTVVTRYCIPLLYINFFILIFLLYQIVGNKLSIILIILSFGIFVLNNFNINKVRYDYPNQDVQCVESILNKYHVKHGISGYLYNFVRKFNYMNQSNIDMIQVVDHKRFLSMNNEKYEYNAYDFAVTEISPFDKSSFNRLDLSAIIRLNGSPEFMGKCGKYEIVIYKNGMLKKY
jgi:hypothetical protein